LLSWRVAILPYLANDHLYRRFKLDEPWDGPHNRTLLAEMPEVFAPVRPDATTYRAGSRLRGFEWKVEEKGQTYYQAVVGTGAAFEPRRRLRLADDFP